MTGYGFRGHRFTVEECKRLMKFWSELTKEYSRKELHRPDEEAFWGTANLNLKMVRDRYAAAIGLKTI